MVKTAGSKYWFAKGATHRHRPGWGQKKCVLSKLILRDTEQMNGWILTINTTHPKGPYLSPELKVRASLPWQSERMMLSRDLVPSISSLSLAVILMLFYTLC